MQIWKLVDGCETQYKVSEAPVVMSARMIRGDHHHQCSVWIIVGNQCLLIEDHYHFNYRLMTLGQDAVYFRLIPHKAQPSPFPLLVLVLVLEKVPSEGS